MILEKTINQQRGLSKVGYTGGDVFFSCATSPSTQIVADH
jgi:hypothetical protein